MTLRVHLNRVDPWSDATGADEELLVRAARTVLEEEFGGGEGELSVTLVGRDEIAELNQAWLDEEGATDVVAFDLGDDEAVLGDVYLCPEVALEAVERGDAPGAREELVRLVVHGTLHVLGYDHPEGSERWESPMYAIQERLVQRVLEEDAAARRRRGGGEAGC